jgi:hypothetical protein
MSSSPAARTTIPFSSLYVLLGGMLIAMGLGVQMPFAESCNSMWDTPKAEAPAGDVIEVETVK